jgi:hypothetical protein
MTNKLNLIRYFWAIVILKVKSSKDILKGLNKLDHLIKVSIYQSYRKGLENQEEVKYY